MIALVSLIGYQDASGLHDWFYAQCH